MPDPYKEFVRRTPRSRELFERSRESIALEVVGTVDMPYPVYIAEGSGSRVVDVDGNEYIDLTMGFGSHVLGHAHPEIVTAVTEAVSRGTQFGIHTPYQEPLAELFREAVPCADLVMFCNTGTEATMYGIRVARAHTAKSGIAVFEGSYHGAHDAVLVQAEDGSPRDRPAPVPMGLGIPGGTVGDVLMLPYRHEAAFDLIRENRDRLAVVLIEPVQGANPTLDCGDFLRKLAATCREAGVLLLFDEVVTGFRLAYGGAQEEFGVTPDLAAYGKALGGGLPIGAVAGRADIMRRFEWQKHQEDQDKVFAGGTFGGNPLTMVAGKAAIGHLRSHPELYERLAGHGRRFKEEIGGFCSGKGLPVQVLAAHSMIHLRFQEGRIVTARDVDRSLADAEREFYIRLMLEGVLIPGDHLALTSTAHSGQDITWVIDAVKKALPATGGLNGPR